MKKLMCLFALGLVFPGPVTGQEVTYATALPDTEVARQKAVPEGYKDLLYRLAIIRYTHPYYSLSRTYEEVESHGETTLEKEEEVSGQNIDRSSVDNTPYTYNKFKRVLRIPTDTACPAENPDSSYKLTDIIFSDHDYKDLLYRGIYFNAKYTHPYYRYGRTYEEYEEGLESIDPRDWGRAEPEQNILLGLYNHYYDASEATVMVVFNKDLINYEEGKIYYIYLDGRRLALVPDGEYWSTNGVTHIVFETTASNENMILYNFGDEITVHLASGTESACFPISPPS